MSRKINYAAGDNLPLYATPEQSLEYGKQWQAKQQAAAEAEKRNKLEYELYLQKKEQQKRKLKEQKQREQAQAKTQAQAQAQAQRQHSIPRPKPAVQTSMYNQNPQQYSQQQQYTNSPHPQQQYSQQNMYQPQQQYTPLPPQQQQYAPPLPQQQYASPPPQQQYAPPLPQQQYALPPPPQQQFMPLPPKQQQPQMQPQSSAQLHRPPPTPTLQTDSSYRNMSNSSASPGSNMEKPDVKDAATTLFHKFDTQKSGRLGITELQRLLQNDDTTPFSYSSIESLINLFGVSRFGTLNLNEFIYMYHKIKIWREEYVRSDTDRSHTLTSGEFSEAVKNMGYKIPIAVVENLFDQFAEFKDGFKCLKFDKFIESIVWLIRLTKVFRKFDTKSNGVAVIDYKDFIDVSLYLGKFLPH